MTVMNLKLVRIYKFCLVWKFLLVSVPKSAPQNFCPFLFWLLLVLKVEVPFQNKVKGFEEDFLYPIFVEQDDLPVDDTISTVGNLSTSHIAVPSHASDNDETSDDLSNVGDDNEHPSDLSSSPDSPPFKRSRVRGGPETKRAKKMSQMHQTQHPKRYALLLPGLQCSIMF